MRIQNPAVAVYDVCTGYWVKACIIHHSMCGFESQMNWNWPLTNELFTISKRPQIPNTESNWTLINNQSTYTLEVEMEKIHDTSPILYPALRWLFVNEMWKLCYLWSTNYKPQTIKLRVSSGVFVIVNSWRKKIPHKPFLTISAFWKYIKLNIIWAKFWKSKEKRSKRQRSTAQQLNTGSRDEMIFHITHSAHLLCRMSYTV